VKRCLIVLAALALAGCNNKPTGFGVDVEAKTNMLSSSLRNSIVTARLIVSGAESFNKDIGNVAKAAQSGAFKFRYVPGVHSGSLVIRVNGVDAGGNTVAGGIAPAVNVVDGKSVDAVLTLAVNGNGVTCMAPTDCISGNCVDGVCCDAACDGVCESCNLPGLVGACSPAMTGTDPDGDCAAKLPGADGGIGDDGGMSMVPPMADNPAACAGSCDGNRACAFPDKTTSCGSAVCSAAATVGNFFCDGAGACNEKDSACSDYNCNMGACRTMCGSDADCQPTDFCNLNINKCVPKHDLGTTCVMGDECKSTFCYSGVCCNTTCGDSTQSCANPGSVGQCQCTGHSCPAGVACVLFYRDADTDGFGDNTATLTNGRAIAGCTGDAVPGGYSANNTDCDDGDSFAHPGQTDFYPTPSAGTPHTFDYNCDGVLQKGIAEYTGGCIFCKVDPNFFVCDKPTTTCATNGTQSALACGRTKACFGCCPVVTTGFTTTVACGVSHATTNCGTCTADNGGPTTSVGANVTQTCH
jgi:hypothetical protein